MSERTFDPAKPLCVVTSNWDLHPDDLVWTVSQDPENTGWNTDCGCPGYGLTQADAQLLADRWNAAL